MITLRSYIAVVTLVRGFISNKRYESLMNHLVKYSKTTLTEQHISYNFLMYQSVNSE